MTAAEQLVLEIRRRHLQMGTIHCWACAVTWPCHAIRAADQIDALLARVGETITAAGPAPAEAER